MSRVSVSILEATQIHIVKSECGLTTARSSPNRVAKIRAVFPRCAPHQTGYFGSSSLILKSRIHRLRLPDFANDLQRHRTVLVHGLPFESNFQTRRHAIVDKNPSIVYGMVFRRVVLNPHDIADEVFLARYWNISEFGRNDHSGHRQSVPSVLGF